MNNSTKAKIIVDVIKNYAASATFGYIDAEADLARAQMGHDLWKEENYDSLELNPYNTETAQKMVTLKREEKAARDEVLAYAIEVFLNKIPDDLKKEA